LGKHVEEQKDAHASQSNQQVTPQVLPQVTPEVLPQDPQESNEAQLP
jgi:hypothetical protein